MLLDDFNKFEKEQELSQVLELSVVHLLLENGIIHLAICGQVPWVVPIVLVYMLIKELFRVKIKVLLIILFAQSHARIEVHDFLAC